LFGRFHLRSGGVDDLRRAVDEWPGESHWKEITSDRIRLVHFGPFQAIDCGRRPEPVARWIVEHVLALAGTTAMIGPPAAEPRA
jgi:hypothetical protein